MSAPSIGSITFDKSSYNPGDTITATIDYTPGTTAKTQTLTGTAIDSVSGLTGTLTQTFTINQPDATSLTVTDSGARTWTKQSDTGTVAKFTAAA